MADTTETLFTVARGTTALTDLRRDIRSAKADLAAIEGSMRAAKLEPDVQLATVTRTTTLSDPAPYVELPVAVDEPLTDEAEDAPTEQANVDPAQDAEPADDEADH